MPKICYFFGIVITMYWEKNAKHNKPHFHALYSEYSCTFSLPELDILEGKLPKNGMRLVKEWANLHLAELLENWQLAIRNKPLNMIKPLE